MTTSQVVRNLTAPVEAEAEAVRLLHSPEYVEHRTSNHNEKRLLRCHIRLQTANRRDRPPTFERDRQHLIDF